MKKKESFGSMAPIILRGKKWVPLTNFLKRKKYSKIFILADTNTVEHCVPSVERVLKSQKIHYSLLTVQEGEISKNLETCQKVWESLTSANADRNSLLINVGGGMICDLGGFVASTYKRGIQFINIPTSLLAIVDASIGGKCGIDFGRFKNHIGLFNTAEKTFVYPNFMQTLVKEELKSGMAEVYKHALITDKRYWTKLSTTKKERKTITNELLKRSIAIKLSIVEKDPLEKKERKKLNFGHTIGHAIESFFLELSQPVPHGIAVAAGMIIESYLSISHASLSKKEFNQIEKTLSAYFPKLSIKKEHFPIVMETIKNDKKNRNSGTRFTLLRSIGRSIVDVEVEEKEIQKALSYYFSN